ncbi:phosphatase [Stereum hirsutum FP-91666 SS1]|uniref:phosphatase n=1 Tax=Stereum hirsutum (strain FP-91666) TaxID=721885 RepID=UPI000440F7AB|nr:phosphatase [Stereum hirsutum FP-91666 SS1]EIM87938.1 phosphatase [Stereum hirsutum FP-91666 SS1]
MSTTTKPIFDAILFDMDGTLIDSTAGVIGAWNLFKEKYPGLDVEQILSSAHGVRTVENLRIHCGIQDPAEQEREAERFERAIVTTSNENGRGGIKLLPGAKDAIDALTPGTWTVCTSATRAYASTALPSVGVTIPETIVFAEDVKQGKPAPDPYLLGAHRLSKPPTSCLVVEDAPAGVRSGKAAGCKTLGLLTTHGKSEMEAAGADWIVEDLASVKMTVVNGKVEVSIRVD